MSNRDFCRIVSANSGKLPLQGKRCEKRHGLYDQVGYSNRHPEEILGRPVHGSASKGSCSERGEGC